MITVPFLDLRAAYFELKPQIDDAVARVLDSGWYIGGTEVEAFVNRWLLRSSARGWRSERSRCASSRAAIGRGRPATRSLCLRTRILPHGLR